MTSPISSAANKIDANLSDDSKFKKPEELLKASLQYPTLSGLQDVDYPNILNYQMPIISDIRSVPLPTEVIEQFRNMQYNCTLGIFPELSRAWLSVDSCIFFWAYDNASDVSYYDGLDKTIIGVHLIKPKPDVFKSHIKYLLCLVTAVDITLLEVTCPTNDDSILTFLLIPDPVFKISTDNVLFPVVAGTDDGRIFLGGNDGCLYEIIYQAQDGWFSRKCKKINHSYGIMSYITPTFLNFAEPEPIKQIEIDSSRKLLYILTEKSTIQLYDLGNDGQSIRLVCSKSLSAVVNQASCIARTIETTNFKPIIGIKSITRFESQELHLVAVTQFGVRLYFSACGTGRPGSLNLVHVRLPPGFTPSSIIHRPASVSKIYHRDNTFIITSTQSENKDSLWVMTNDFYVYEDQMMESFSVNSLNGRVWCIEEEIRPTIRVFEEPEPPLVVKQQFEGRRKFILLTSDGVQIFHKQRPIDQLRLLLDESHGPDSLSVKTFFHSTKLTEACLTALILASTSNLPQEVPLVEWATQAFFRYGGEPKVMKHNDQTDVHFSARHDAIYLYMARVLRPIWNQKVADIENLDSQLKCLTNTVTIDEITLYLKRLIELRKFLVKNLDSFNLEKESINSLDMLLTRCIEVFNLYRLLYEHQFATVCANLPAEPQRKLSVMTFRHLIVSGNDMTTNIASALVRRYLDDNITTDAISRRLHEMCPSIFRQENALQAKAHEMILKSRAIVDQVDKERMMNEAVTLLKKIGPRLELQSVTDLLYSARAHKHIVDICLFVADKRDPLNLASHQQTKSTLDDGDERNKAQAFSHRMDSYNKIIDTLDRLTNSDDFDQVFQYCTKSTDEIFHTRLYEWLCDKNLSTKLLQVRSPFVEGFLKKRADTNNYTYLDLLWKLYERRGNFYNAAQILDRLASKPCTDYGLEERLEYLSRAKGCVEALATPGEYLHELEEKMEVVKIQIQVFNKLKEFSETPPIQEATAQLNYCLSDLTQLYQNYAQKFNLYDCQLAILKCGNHHDPVLIDRLWKNVIDEVLMKNSHEPRDSQLHILSNRVETLGKILAPSETFLPLYNLISYLEWRTYTFNSLRWVPNCFLKIGFKPSDLIEPYHKFYKSRDQSLNWPGKPIHALQVINCLMRDSLNRSDRAFATICLDVICDYLIDLQTLVNTDCNAKKLQENFTDLQLRINQLLN